MTQDEKDALAELMTVLPEDLARDIMKLRTKKRATNTPRAARKLVKEYRKTADPVNAADTQLVRGWVGFEAEWIAPKTRGGYRDYHNPSPVQSANYGNPDVPPAPRPLSDEEKRRRAEVAARASAVVRGAASKMGVH